jgi:hypothetical protein
MSEYLVKSLIAVVFLGTVLTSFFSMMALMGKAEHGTAPEKLRRLHKRSGIAALVLLAPLVYFGASFLAELRGGLSVRAVFHFVLAAFLLAVILLKVFVALVYRQFLKYAPGLGMTIFALTLVIFLITAGYYFLQLAAGK